MDIEKAITDGIVFKGGKSSGRKNEEKVKNESEEEKLYHRTSWLGFGQNESRYPKKNVLIAIKESKIVSALLIIRY